MILTSTDQIEGMRIREVKGLVQGNTVLAKHIGRDVLAGLRNIVGGEIGQYTAMMSESREQAVARMVQEAEELGANAVVGVRFTTSMIVSQAAEVLAYGTAVTVEPA